MFYKNERLAIFIDGPNTYNAAKSISMEIDYKLLRQEFMQRGKLQKFAYYSSVSENDVLSPVRPLIDWLQYNGFSTFTKPTKEYVDASGKRKIKGNMSVDISVGIMEIAPHIDHIVLFSGDGDLRPLLESIQRQCVRVTVVSTLKAQTPMISDDLRRQADNFIDLGDLLKSIQGPARTTSSEVASDKLTAVSA